MKIHHLNCGTLCPFASRWVCGTEAKLVCHCLLIELGDRLVLVDSGFGTEDVRNRRERLGEGIRIMRGANLMEETALEQVRKLGFRPEDVSDVVLTHLDLDHAGGISDFPRARVHVHLEEHRMAMLPQAEKDFMTRERYRPAHWKHGPMWRLYSPKGESWFGFEAVRGLDGLPNDILMVPLRGHTLGHCGIAVKHGKGWLLHAGDSYFHHGEMEVSKPAGTWALEQFQRLIAMDGKSRVRNQERLRYLVREHGSEVRVFSAHDALEYRNCKSAQG